MRLALAVALLWGGALADGLGPVVNSAPVGTMLIHADIAPFAMPPVDTFSARLFFSTDSQRTWTQQPMFRMAEPGYDSAWQTVVTVPPGPGRLWYYANADDGQGYATQSPLNATDEWPIPDNLLARVATDPVGDAVSPDGNWVDLTGARVGRSQSRFYVELTNNHTSWPTSATNKRYVYSAGFANPEAPSDSWVFAPVYVSAWPVMETGLFAINRYTGATPERIGNIETSTSGNRLRMRCNIADLTGDRRFGPWPNTQGWLQVAAATQTITLFPERVVTNDTTIPGIFHALHTPQPVIGANRPFTLTFAEVRPDTGTPDTEFSFSVHYTDPDSNPPTRRILSFTGLPDSLLLVPDTRRWWRGTTFRARRRGFPPGPQEAAFTFSDGDTTITARASFYITDTVGLAEEPRRRPDDAWRPPALARGVLLLPAPPGPDLAMFSVTGRRQLTLRPGANDLAGLAPGVYFITDPGGRSWPVRVIR